MIRKDAKSKLPAPANPLKKTQEKAASSAVSFVGIYPAPPPKPRNKNKARVIVTVIAAFVASLLLVAVSIILFVPPERDQQAHNRIPSVTKPVDSKLLREERSNEDISASNARENIASLMDDGMRGKGYKDHISLGKEDTNLMIVSDAYSDEEGRQIFLSVTLPGWNRKLCSAGFKSVTLASGVLSLNHTYSLYC